MKQITAILLHYNRQKNIGDVITGLHQQTNQPEIWLWDNSNNAIVDGRVDVLIKSTKNFYCQPRFWLAGMAQSEYIFTQDDDFKIKDTELFNKLIEVSKKYPDYLIGTRGKVLNEHSNKEQPYQHNSCWITQGECDIVNTGLCFFRTEILKKLPLTPFFGTRAITEKEYINGDDIWISSFNKCYAYDFKKSVDQIDECGIGLSKMCNHMGVRNELCKRYWL